MPDWYKDAPIFVKNKDSRTPGKVIENQGIVGRESDFTIKKCMPVFDTLSAGYILKIPNDINIYQSKVHESDEDYKTHFAWTELGAVAAHDIEQVEGYPHSKVHTLALPKFINPWIIKTPPGYSCLFITPMHRGLPFTILPGIVDTDTFEHAVNFPFEMNQKGFEGILKAGTPMAQVIPFKRDEFALEVYTSDDEYKEKYPRSTVNTKEFTESYKKGFWHKKTFK
jgi:hypothetical protein